MEYLKFMSALTNDILCRGIFSDRYYMNLDYNLIENNFFNKPYKAKI